MNESTCIVEAVEGSNITHGKSVFSHSSRYLSAACDDHVKVYSVRTGQLVQTLRRHEAEVTAICVHPRNPQQLHDPIQGVSQRETTVLLSLQAAGTPATSPQSRGPLSAIGVLSMGLHDPQIRELVSASLDGNMILWDPADGACLKVIHFNTPLYGFCFRPTAQEDDLCLLIQRKSKGKKQNEEKEVIVAVVLCWAAVSSPGSAEASPALLLDKAPSLLWHLRTGKVAFTHQGTHLVGFSRRLLLIHDFHLDRTVRYDFLNPHTAPLTTLLHWHANCVNDICFTHDGAYLLSVGIEGVLVLWQVDTQQNHFRPRLGGAITSVSVSPRDEWIALGMQNNVIKVLSAHNNEVETTAGGLRKAYVNTAAANGVLTGIVREPQSERLVLNSSLGHIQLYNPLTRQLSEEVSVTSLNFVSQADSQVPIIPTVIAFVAFSNQGQWMATVELRDDGQTVQELRMKFWAYKHHTQSYELNTLVDPPHLGASITGLIFQPGPKSIDDGCSPACVTTATNGHFKVWRLTGQTLESGPPPIWVCCSESHHLEEPALGCSFSQDGSLLAVVYDSHLTLWRAETSQLKKVFPAPSQNETFRHVWFGSRDCSHFLVASSSLHLTVWNVLSSSVCWSVRCDVEYIVGSPFSSHMAAFVRNESKLNVCVFTPKHPKPLSVYEDVCDAPHLGAVFLKDARTCAGGDGRQEEEGDPHWSDSSSLYFLSSQQVLFRIGRQREKAKQQLRLTSYEGETQTTFEQIFGWRPEMESESQGEDTVPSLVSSRSASKLFSGPPHTLPPISSLCSNFLATLTGRPKAKREAVADVSQACNDDTEDNDSVSERSDSGLHGEMAAGLEVEQAEQKMDTSGPTTTPSETTTTPSAAGEPSIAVGNFIWLTDVFKSFK